MSKRLDPVRPIRVPALLATACLAGCSDAPSQNILGSFFPSWLLCAVIGVIFAVGVRLVLSRVGLDRVLPMALATYTAIAFSFACLLWLIRFGD